MTSATPSKLYSEFSRTGKAYLPFPDPGNYRFLLADLAKAEVFARYTCFLH